MRGPDNGLVTLLQRALRRLFETWRRAALRYHYSGNIWRWRHLQGHRRRLVRRDACLALRPHSRFLQRDPINDWGHIAWQIGEAYPINAVARAAVVNDCLPLHETRRRYFGCAARFCVRAEPARPLAARVFRVPRAHKKFQSWVSRCVWKFSRAGRRRAPPFDASPVRETLRVEAAAVGR